MSIQFAIAVTHLISRKRPALVTLIGRPVGFHARDIWRILGLRRSGTENRVSVLGLVYCFE